MQVKFTSEWDGGSVVVTPCEYNPSTGEVSPDMVDTDIDGVLDREYITLEDGEEIEVCPVCHSYVMKTVVGDRADESYGEYMVCSDPDCYE